VPKNKYKDMFIYREGYVFSDYDKIFMEKVRESISKVSLMIK